MAHVHQHAEDQSSYYLDQLFMIGVSGALAGVTITLWYSGLLGKILHPKFHIWVLLGGLSLLALVVLRAAAVWRSVDEAAPHTHDHEHDHEDEACACGHEHHHDHDHAHGHAHGSAALATAPAAHVHDHGHGHAHTHTHAHTHDHGHAHGWAPWRYVVLLLPVVMYFLILSNPAFDREPVATPVTGMDMVINFIIRFRSIVWEALPFIVLGAIIAGLLEELLPQQAITRFLPRNPFLAVGLGGLIGLVFPMCECGIVPIMRRLLRKGLPLSCCIAYVLAGPIINVVVLLSTFVAFSGMENTFEGGRPSYQMGGWWMTGLRAGLGYLVAVTTALVVEWQYRKHGDALLTPLARRGAVPGAADDGARKKALWERVNNVSETALHDFVDITVFLILGALLSAGAVLLVSQDQIASLSRQHAPLAILAMMGMAVLLCLCSEADAFVAASFVTLRPAAKLAFLVLGPMIDFKLYFMYTRVFRARLIWTIYLSVVAQVFVYSYATHLLWEEYAPRLVHPVQPPGQGPSPAVYSAARTVGLASNPAGAGPLAAAAAEVLEKKTEKVMEVDFARLEMASASLESRSYFEGRRIKLRGRYAGINDRSFTLIRYSIRCCAADAIPLKAIIRLDDKSKQTLPVAQLRDKWVLVTGEVHFLQQPGTGLYYTALLLHPSDSQPLGELVEVVPPDNNPFSF